MKVVVNKQKIQDKSPVDKRVVADSVADELIMQGKEFDPKQCNQYGIEVAYIWEAAKAEKKPAKADKK